MNAIGDEVLMDQNKMIPIISQADTEEMSGFGKTGPSPKRNRAKTSAKIKKAIKQAISEYQLGHPRKALNLLKSVDAEQTRDGFIIGVLATTEKALGNIEEAIRLFEKSISIDADQPDILHNYSGLCLERDGEKALLLSSRASALMPMVAAYKERLGYIQLQLGDIDSAIATTLEAMRIDPQLVDARLNLSAAYTRQKRYQEALDLCAEALHLRPGYARIHYQVASIRLILGNSETAKSILMRALDINHKETGAIFALSRLIESKEDAQDLLSRAEIAWQERAGLATRKEHAMLEFAISECLHKLARYEEAGEHLSRANQEKLYYLPSDASHILNEIKRHKDPIKSASRIDNEDGERNIFIVGMPRSGSTLLESCLSRMPSIIDLGETRALEKSIKRLREAAGNNRESMCSLNSIYTEAIQPIDQNYSYTTDKQLYNFLYTRTIVNHMPSAKIIHCQRNPMDNILSMFRGNLQPGNNFTSDLKDAARVLIAQSDIMKSHKKEYPRHIYTFNYDQFVLDPEEHLRPLLEWLRLDWNADCLHPERSERIIDTASVTQARRPINNKSVGGWLNYREILKPAEEIIRQSGLLEDC